MTESISTDADEAQFNNIHALVLLGDKRAIDPLLDILRDKSAGGSLRQSAGLALGNLKSPAVLPLIERLQDETEERYVRAAVAEALGSIGDERAIEPLVKALKDESSHVRERAADALGRFHSAEPTSALIDVLDDEDPLVTCSALWSLGKVGGADVVSYISRYRSHKNDTVRQNVNYALETLRERRITDV